MTFVRRTLASAALALCWQTAAGAATTIPMPLPDDPAADKVIADYISMCMYGEAKFAPGQIQNVSWNDLPTYLREWYSGTPEGTYYHITNPKYEVWALHFVRSDPVGTEYKEGCAVAAKGLSFRRAMVETSAALNHPMSMSELLRLPSDATYNAMPKGGVSSYTDPTMKYSMTIAGIGTHHARYVVMQTSFLNDHDRAQRLAAQKKYVEQQARNRAKGEHR